MAELIPWAEFEQEYAENFAEKMGAPAKPFRMALGALIIKEKLGVSDRETVEQIGVKPRYVRNRTFMLRNVNITLESCSHFD